MVRSAKVGFVCVASVAAGIEAYSSTRATLVAVLLVATVGVAATEADAVKYGLSYLGLIYQVTTFVSEIGRLLLLKILVSMPTQDPGSALLLSAPVCFIFLLGPALYLEGGQLASVSSSQWLGLHCPLMLNGALAVLLNVLIILMVGAASPTVFALVTTVNTMAGALISLWFFQVEASAAQLGCFFVTLAAAYLYQQHQIHNELPSWLTRKAAA